MENPGADFNEGYFRVKLRTTAAIWFRFASPNFLLHCVPQKLHIAVMRKRCAKLFSFLDKPTSCRHLCGKGN